MTTTDSDSANTVQCSYDEYSEVYNQIETIIRNDKLSDYEKTLRVMDIVGDILDEKAFYEKQYIIFNNLKQDVNEFLNEQ